MSYHVYTTESLILKGNSNREADGYFSILTRDLGVITAGAKGVRLLRSKLAPSLLEASYSTLSLVRGRYSWRIIGGTPITNTAHSFDGRSRPRIIWFHFLHTVRFLISGEEKNVRIFSLALGFHESLSRRDFQEDELNALECLGIFHLMYELGYAHARPEYEAFFQNDLFSDISIQKAIDLRPLIVDDLNRALAASQT